MPNQDKVIISRSAFFDFEEAVAEARRDFPHETRYTSFVDLDSPSAMQSMRKWFQSLDRDSQHILLNSGTAATLDPRHAGFTVTAPSGEKIVGVHSRKIPGNLFFPNSPAKGAAFAFYHELGHVVVKQGWLDIGAPVNKGEHAADAFAIMRGFQKGILDKKDAKHIADRRLTEAMTSGGFDHLTTMTLDAIIINPKDTDFVSLTPKQTAKIAKAHAEAFSNGAQQEANLSTVFRSASRFGYLTEESMMQNMTRIALYAKNDSNEFYIAARALLPTFRRFSAREIAPMLQVSEENVAAIGNKILAKAGERDIGALAAMKNPSITPEPPGLVKRIKNWFKPLAI